MSRLIALVRAWLTHRRLPIHLALLAMLLCAPAIEIGFFLDDYIHQAALTQPEALPQVHASPGRLFEFVSEEQNALAAFLPWWSSKDLKLAFWRPLSGAGHWLDHHLWPHSPRLMHVHSLLWLGLTVIAAAVAFRRILGAGTWVAGLAGLLFAVDDLHAWPAMWIANRNALLSVAFGLLSLIAYDSWRRQGKIQGAWATPCFLLLAVLSGESAVACGGYLLAYALVLDTGPWTRRLVALLPSAAVGLIWLTVYKLQGFGARGSSAYLDPLTDPLRFLGGLFDRIPILMLGIWTPIPADIYLQTSIDGQRLVWTLAVGVLLLGAGICAPLLLKDPRAQFCALGLAGSLIPAAIILPMNRQLLFAGFGAAGLLALFVEHVSKRNTNAPFRTPMQAMAAFLLAIHLMLAPLMLLAIPPQLNLLARLLERAVFSLPSDPEIGDQRLVVVHSPGHVFTSGAQIVQVLHGRPTARELLVLSASIWSLEIERLDERSLAVRPDGGFLPPAGFDPTGQDGTFNLMRVFSGFDLLFFDNGRLPMLGDRFDRPGVEIQITALTSDGRPQEAVFRFDRLLEDKSLRWVRWQDGVFVPVSLPRIGESITLPHPRLRGPASD